MDSFNKNSKGYKHWDNIRQFLRHFLAKQKPYFSPKDDRIISFENHDAWKAWERMRDALLTLARFRSASPRSMI